MADAKRLENRIGILGWLTRGRRGFEGYLYLLHRISGIALMLFLGAHAFVTGTRLFGEEAWEKVMGLTHNPIMQFLEYLVYAAFVFHGVNGVRLLLIETGHVIGRPEEPVFPYKSSLNVQRGLSIFLMIVAAVVIALGGFEILHFEH